MTITISSLWTETPAKPIVDLGCIQNPPSWFIDNKDNNNNNMRVDTIFFWWYIIDTYLWFWYLDIDGSYNFGLDLDEVDNIDELYELDDVDYADDVDDVDDVRWYEKIQNDGRQQWHW